MSIHTSVGWDIFVFVPVKYIMGVASPFAVGENSTTLEYLPVELALFQFAT
ncbi:MAG TPA: hypothetical protein VN939_07805 [Chthoniobacterales bacterium]|nr:hypothetical protein [Chthoniobacterales bacterium]